MCDCLLFREMYGDPRNQIYKFEADESSIHIGDMNLLQTNDSVLSFSQHLDLYWRGETLPEYIEGYTPFFEVLAPLPIKIEKVEY